MCVYLDIELDEAVLSGRTKGEPGARSGPPRIWHATQPGRTERAFGPAHGPTRTGPIGPGSLGKLAGPSCDFRPEN